MQNLRARSQIPAEECGPGEQENLQQAYFRHGFSSGEERRISALHRIVENDGPDRGCKPLHCTFPGTFGLIRAKLSNLRSSSILKRSSVTLCCAAAPSIRTAEAPSCIVIDHDGINVALRTELRVDLVAHFFKVRRYIEYQGAWFSLNHVPV